MVEQPRDAIRASGRGLNPLSTDCGVGRDRRVQEDVLADRRPRRAEAAGQDVGGGAVVDAERGQIGAEAGR